MLRHTLIFLRERQTHTQTDYSSYTSTVTAHSRIWLAETRWQLDRCSRGGTHGRLERVRCVFSMSAFWLHEQESCHSRSHRRIPWNRRGAAWARDRMRRQNCRTHPNLPKPDPSTPVSYASHADFNAKCKSNDNFQTSPAFTPASHLFLIYEPSKSSAWYLSIIKPYPLTITYQYK